MNKIIGTIKKPRISVFRSNRYISAQFVDDEQGITLFGLSSKAVKAGKTPVEKALETGKMLAATAKDKKIVEAVYDRNNFRYHGQVKALAEGLRAGGLKF